MRVRRAAVMRMKTFTVCMNCAIVRVFMAVLMVMTMSMAVLMSVPVVVRQVRPVRGVRMRARPLAEQDAQTLDDKAQADSDDDREAKSVTRPRAKTPSVCVIVTVKPRNAACAAVPREPTRYAPTTVFP